MFPPFGRTVNGLGRIVSPQHRTARVWIPRTGDVVRVRAPDSPLEGYGRRLGRIYDFDEAETPWEVLSMMPFYGTAAGVVYFVNGEMIDVYEVDGTVVQYPIEWLTPALWATPVKTEHKGASRPGQRRGQLSEEFWGEQVNPDWLEWLSGFPLGWTNLGKPLPGKAVKTWQGRTLAGTWWAQEPGKGVPRAKAPKYRGQRLFPDRVGRIEGVGNSQVPIAAALAFRLLTCGVEWGPGPDQGIRGLAMALAQGKMLEFTPAWSKLAKTAKRLTGAQRHALGEYLGLQITEVLAG